MLFYVSFNFLYIENDYSSDYEQIMISDTIQTRINEKTFDISKCFGIKLKQIISSMFADANRLINNLEVHNPKKKNLYSISERILIFVYNLIAYYIYYFIINVACVVQISNLCSV